MFYTARRSESWVDIAKAAQVLKENETNDEAAEATLTFNDIVFEFKENPGELFLFPKEAILEAIPDSSEVPCIRLCPEKTGRLTPIQVLASFLLPLDPSKASDFNLTAQEKISRWGAESNIPKVQEYANKPHSRVPSQQESNADVNDDVTYSPATMRLFAVDETLLYELQHMVYDQNAVRAAMTKKVLTMALGKYITSNRLQMKKPAKRLYLQLSSDEPGIAVSTPSGEKVVTDSVYVGYGAECLHRA